MAETHAQLRARERIGPGLDLAAVAAAIGAGRSLLSQRQENGRELHLMRCGGRTLRLIWEPRDEVIITVLPADARLRTRGEDAARPGIAQRGTAQEARARRHLRRLRRRSAP